jgi:hypothetical protein
MGRQIRAALVAAALAVASCAASAEPVTLRFGQIPSTVRGTSSVYLHLADSKVSWPAKGSSSNAC